MKTIAIIGDSRGIGAALRSELLEHGHRVIGVSRSGSGEQRQGYTGVAADAVESPVDLSSFCEQLDGFCYCPGTITLKPFASIKEEQVLGDLRVNYLGAFLNLQANLRLLKKGNDPSVVFFSTVAVKTGMAFHSSISGAKAAVEGLTRSLAAELAPMIRVNAIAPSLTNTSLAEPLLNNDKKQEAAATRHPLKRVGSAEELAAMATFLLEPQSAWITGQVFAVDGGMSTLRV
jgi:NAD(P)-dependent dehydrogenase (short-subunit alcohol dehydrogenase family)